MLNPEEVEIAESNGYFTMTKIEGDGMNLTRKAEQETPNGYRIFQEYENAFTLTDDGVIEPTSSIMEKVVKNGHIVHDGSDRSTYPIRLFVFATGELQLDENQEQVIDGNMEIVVNYQWV